MLHTQAHEAIDYLDHATIIKAGNIPGEIKHFLKTCTAVIWMSLIPPKDSCSLQCGNVTGGVLVEDRCLIMVAVLERD